MAEPDQDLNDVIAGVHDSHARLAQTIEALTDEQARGASALPDWTVGHVLTHIARNADSHVRMLRGAMAGEPVTQYAGGNDSRNADIEAGAGRPAVVLIDDVVSSAAALEEAWREMTPQAWGSYGLNAGGEKWSCLAMPFHRWREVELHHVDLGLGYTAADWPDGYLARDLPLTLELLPERLSEAEQRRLLAWLVGRAPQPDALALAPWQSRRDHYLRRRAGAGQ